MGSDGSGRGKGRAAAWKVATESAAIDRRRKCPIFFSNNGLCKNFFGASSCANCTQSLVRFIHIYGVAHTGNRPYACQLHHAEKVPHL